DGAGSSILGGSSMVGGAQALFRVAPLTDLKVTPSDRNVVISFASRPNIGPIIEIGKVAPTKQGGRWSFRGPQAQARGWEVRSTGDPAQGRYLFDLSHASKVNLNDPPNFSLLSPGVRYFYIINIPTGLASMPTYQRTGEFVTVMTTVKVTFEKITIQNDSDADSNGDLVFVFFANGDAHRKQLGNLDTPLDWGEGEHPIHEELVVSDAPDKLQLAVNGLDDDRIPFPRYNFPLNWDYEPGIIAQGPPGDLNAAIHTFDLNELLGNATSKRVNFFMDSSPVSPAQNNEPTNLRFTVHGTMEITRASASFSGSLSATATPPSIGSTSSGLTVDAGKGKLFDPARSKAEARPDVASSRAKAKTRPDFTLTLPDVGAGIAHKKVVIPKSATSPANFGGTWEAQNENGKFDLTLQQTGNQVTGSYTQGHGTLTGTVTGRTLNVNWRWDNGDTGVARFELAEDGNSFHGNWSYGATPPANNQWQSFWNGTRQAQSGGAGGAQSGGAGGAESNSISNVKVTWQDNFKGTLSFTTAVPVAGTLVQIGTEAPVKQADGQWKLNANVVTYNTTVRPSGRSSGRAVGKIRINPLKAQHSVSLTVGNNLGELKIGGHYYYLITCEKPPAQATGDFWAPGAMG
ncbi:MAG: hypothetical protein M3347_04610, partial [Armatimonadota bacterium]|nr:hypothetical protein [Armatimonadota bacterium]